MLKATIYIALFSIFSKILGLARIVAFSNRFGASQEMDIYVAAFRIPDLLFNLLILGTLSAAFIPVFVDYLEKNKEEAGRLAATIFNLALVVMLIAAGLGFMFAPLLVSLIAPGFDEAMRERTVELTRILMLSPVFFGLSSVLTSILHSFKRFIAAAVSPLVYNLAIIAGILFVYPVHGLRGVVWSVIAGALLHFLTQLPWVLRLGVPLLRHFDLRSSGVKKIAKLFLPRILGLDLGQIGLFVASIIGSTMAAGSISIYYYAFDLETVPLGVFAIAFAVTAFPVLSQKAARNDIQGFKDTLSKSMVQLLFLIIPMSVLMLILRAQIVRLIPGAGENTNFSFADTRLTAQALGFFAISLFAQAIVPLIARGFYALKNTITPVVVGAIAIGINASLAFWFTRMWEASSLALAFSLAVIFDALVLFLILRRRLGSDLNDDFLFLRIVKIGIASVVMGIISYLALYAIAPLVNMQTYAGVLTQALGALVLGGVAYLASGVVIELREAREFVAVIKTWLVKFSKPVASAVESLFTDIR